MSSNCEVRKILLVEDEPAITKVCQRVLVREGYELDTAGDGRIAEGMLKERSYDLLIIDIRTPRMDGRELYQLLEKEYPSLCQRVIFTTGDVLAKDIGTFLEETGRPFLLKPFNPEELRSIVRKTIKSIKK